MAFGLPMTFNSLPKKGKPVKIILRSPVEGDEEIISQGISRAKVNEYTNTNRTITTEMEREFFTEQAKEANSAFWVIAVACYFPLYSISGAEKLLQKNYSSLKFPINH